jgi:hypothetical protein
MGISILRGCGGNKEAGYPPDMELLATENVLKQEELLADDWVIENM